MISTTKVYPILLLTLCLSILAPFLNFLLISRRTLPSSSFSRRLSRLRLKKSNSPMRIVWRTSLKNFSAVFGLRNHLRAGEWKATTTWPIIPSASPALNRLEPAAYPTSPDTQVSLNFIDFIKQSV